MDTIYKKQLVQDLPITMQKIDRFEMGIKKLGGQPEIIFEWAREKYKDGVSPVEDYLGLALDALKRGLSTNEIKNNL